MTSRSAQRSRRWRSMGSRHVAIAHRPLLLAERSWRRLNGRELLLVVRAGVRFKNGGRVEREDDQVRVFAKKRLTVNQEERGKAAA